MNLAHLRKLQAVDTQPPPTPAEEMDDANEVDPASLIVTNNAPLPEKAPIIPAGVTGRMAAILAAKQNTAGEDPAQFGEIRRIINLDVLGPFTPAEVEEFSRRNVLPEAFVGRLPGGQPLPEGKPFRLHEAQARGAFYFDRYGGLFAPMGAGAGKTLLSIMIAERHWRRTAKAAPNGRNTSLLLIPPEVYQQLMKRIGERPSDVQWARNRVPVTVPFIGLHGQDREERMTLAKRQNGCFVMPHSLMSAKDTTLLLEIMQPSLVQVDEAHKFKNFSVARTKRLMHYIAKKRPKFVVLSGTMTNKSLRSHHHFLEPSIRDMSPLPISEVVMGEWAAVVDSDADPTEEMKKALDPLVDWARFKFPKVNFRQDVSGFRLAQRLRTLSAPGVVATHEAPAPCGLIVQMIEAPHVVPEQQEALKAIVDQVSAMTSPNGDPIEDARQQHGWFEQLTAGFYYRLEWPTPETLMTRLGISAIEAKDLLERSIARLAAQRVYLKALREWMRDNPHAVSPEGRPLDTPWGVGADMLRHKSASVGGQLYALWMNWKRSGVEPGVDPFSKEAGVDLIERDSIPVPISDYKIRAALAWVLKFRSDPETSRSGALIWYKHQHVGSWLTTVLRQRVADPDGDFGVMHCPAGDAANVGILNPKNKTKIVVASMAHSIAKNLQGFSHQLIIQWPRSSNDLEQLLARTHRHGQLADELVAHVLVAPGSEPGEEKRRAGDSFDQKVVAASMRDATYSQQILGNKQRALIARWNPLPKMFDQTTLLEMGFEVDKLDARAEAFLKEKFG